MVLIKNNLQSSLIEQKEWLIAIDLNLSSTKLTFIFLYLNPSKDIKVYLESLKELVNELLCENLDRKIVIAGDFNARIGDLNNFTSDKLDDVIYENWNCSTERSTLDELINQRGTLLTDTMECLDFFVINGRSISDKPAHFTFNGFQKNKSIVDLAWANNAAMEEIRDFKVLDFILNSDHLPILLTFQSASPPLKTLKSPKSAQTNRTPRIKWIPSKLEQFHSQLSINESICNTSIEIEELATNVLKCIKTAAKNAEMETGIGPRKGNKPWFTEESTKLKRATRKAHRALKNGNYTDELFKIFNEARKNYRKYINEEKKNYYTHIQQKLADVKSNAEFWSTVKLYKNKKSNYENPISMATWEKFLEEEYKGNPTTDLVISNVNDVTLDNKFTIDELKNVLAKCKPNKAPGPDGINNDFLKNLTESMLKTLLALYNKILTVESMPAEWVKAKLCLIHKKGDRENPMNYRGIALINNILKIFTSLITQRLQTWIDERKILREEQFGFRKGRGCQEAIFTLYAATSINLRLEGRKVYAIFVDFQRAFDSVPHDLLWQKLDQLKISAKIIRILKDLYGKAKFQFEQNGEPSKIITISKGVLQGESASPILFNIFINDLIKYLQHGGVRGVNIDNNTNIQGILYADDLAILTDTKAMAQRALVLLEEYSIKNQITVNENKTKIMIFRKGGRVDQNTRFIFKNKEIEIVSQFSYLGVLFSQSGLFLKATESAKKKANLAIANAHNLLVKSQLQNWKARIQIFNTTISTVLLYGAETWALRYYHQLDTITCSFIKRTYNLQLCTPAYIIRTETALERVEVKALERTLKWHKKLETMDNSSLPKKCHMRLKELDNLDHKRKNVKYNWVSQLKTWVKHINPKTDNLDNLTDSNNVEELLQDYRTILRLEDMQRVINSAYSPGYQLLIKSEDAQEHLTKEKFNIARLLSQLRTSSKKFVKLTSNGSTYKWSQEALCTVCNLQEEETIGHFILRCPIYQPVRSMYLPQIKLCPANDDDQLWTLLSSQDARKLYYYCKTALMLRSFSVNE